MKKKRRVKFKKHNRCDNNDNINYKPEGEKGKGDEFVPRRFFMSISTHNYYERLS